MPIESSASSSTCAAPIASLAASRAATSVMRTAAGGAGRESLCPHALLDPRPCPVDDDEVDAQGPHQREIVDDAVKLRITGRFTVDLDDERSPAVGVDIGRGAAEPRDEAGCVVNRNGVAHLGHFPT